MAGVVSRRRWSSEEKIRIVMEALNTNIGTAELCRKYSLSPVVFYQWKEKFIEGGRMALSGSVKNGLNRDLEAEVERLKKLIGELTIANDAFKKTLEGRRR
jgi:transposase-like protein